MNTKKIDQAAFKQDVKDGLTVTALAAKHSISWGTAQKWFMIFKGEKPGSEPEPTEEEAPESFDLSINVPAARIMEMLRDAELGDLIAAIDALSYQEQANILQALVQQKFNRLLEKEAAA